MKIYKTVREKVKKCVAVKCDVCKKTYSDRMETQEFMYYKDTAGYDSVFGDLSELSLDMCQHCLKKLLGKYMKIRKWGTM